VQHGQLRSAAPGGVPGWLAGVGRKESESPLLTAETHVTTDRATRYLAQLCEHASHVGRQHPHRARTHARAQVNVQHAEWADSHGILTFDSGLCALEATESALILRAEAADVETLQRIQEALTRRIETIGRRDHLSVTW
jgi:hypothetical protein